MALACQTRTLGLNWRNRPLCSGLRSLKRSNYLQSSSVNSDIGRRLLQDGRSPLRSRLGLRNFRVRVRGLAEVDRRLDRRSSLFPRKQKIVFVIEVHGLKSSPLESCWIGMERAKAWACGLKQNLLLERTKLKALGQNIKGLSLS